MDAWVLERQDRGVVVSYAMRRFVKHLAAVPIEVVEAILKQVRERARRILTQLARHHWARLRLYHTPYSRYWRSLTPHGVVRPLPWGNPFYGPGFVGWRAPVFSPRSDIERQRMLLDFRGVPSEGPDLWTEDQLPFSRSDQP